MLYLVSSQYYRMYLSLNKNYEGKSKITKENTQTQEFRAQTNLGNVGV